MSEFIQLHVLTSYPPANLNRDDLNRPKTAYFGGKLRLRISSQCLKRAWRTSAGFEQELQGHVGIRTKSMGRYVYDALTKAQSLPSLLAGQPAAASGRNAVSEAKGTKWAAGIASCFGKLKAEKKDRSLNHLETEQLVHFGTEEINAIEELLGVVAARGTEPTDKELEGLRQNVRSADIALFGRMLASNPECNVEAAAQVAHAITVHEIQVEDDFFSAVDDLNARDDESGSGHLGELEFAAGVFYLYVCIDRTLLLRNLGNNEALAARALSALVRAVATVAPSGKQNSFGSRAYAEYVLAERGGQQPRSLSTAFLLGAVAPDYMTSAVTSMRKRVADFDRAYASCADRRSEMSVADQKGSLAEIVSFVAGV